MSVVSLLGVKVLNNPANFSAPYEFEITFECLEQLQKGRSLPGSPLNVAFVDNLQTSSGSSLTLDRQHRKSSKFGFMDTDEYR